MVERLVLSLLAERQEKYFDFKEESSTKWALSLFTYSVVHRQDPLPVDET